MTIRALVPPVLWAALVLGACGGDELSREEYTKRATAICREAQRDLRAIGQPGSGIGLVGFATRTQAVVERQARELRALEAPPEIADDVSEALRRVDDLRAKLGRLEAASRSGRAGLIQRALIEVKQVDDQADAVLRRIGLKACAG